MKALYNKLTLLFLLILTISMESCDESVKIPDVSHISPEVEIIRFDHELMQIDTNNVQAGLDQLMAKYPAFTALYFNNILPIANDKSIALSTNLRGFLTDDRIQKLMDTTQIVFKDFDGIGKDLGAVAQYYKHYFPNLELPNFYTLISEFGYQNFIFDDGGKDGIGIGLDMFLGADFAYKSIDPKNPSFSQYLTRTYNKDHLVKKTMEMVVDDAIGKAKGKRMIDQMVHEGKKIFILKKILPHMADTVIFEHTPKQLKWLENNEIEIWSFFAEKSLLYETSLLKTSKYIHPAPNSYGMPEESPGRTAVYIGYKIVEKYMEKFPEKTLEELIADFDAQKMLQRSKYKPKRR